MTDEERQKLCAWLRNPWGNYEELCRQAADELERLANAEVVWKRRAEAYLKIADDKAALAQSDAEPEYHPDGRRRGRSRLVYDKEKRTIVPELRQSDTEPSRSVTMSDAVDQMAMALHDEWYGVGGWSSLTDFERKRWLGVAKVALAKSAEPDAQKKLEEATAYAEQLAISLAARWYPEVSQWKPLSGNLIGLLTQIDNMTTGAVRAQSDAEPVASVAQAIHAEVKAWRLKTDGQRYCAVKGGNSRELIGGATREKAEAAFEALVDEECARAAIIAYRTALAQSDAK